MKKVRTGRTTRMALPSATSTWRTAAKHERAPVHISPAHLEKEQQLENALDEYCLLREQDRSLTASRFCERYPSYRHSLRRLIDVHDAMEGQPALDDENWPELFTEFLGYEILHELGVGAIARVYLATEAALGGRLVAIKVAREGGYEAETLGKLTHPNVVPVFSVKHDEQTDLTAVCMPYHGSATLADLLEIGFEDGKPPVSARTILDAAREREQIVDFVESVSESRPIDSALSGGTYVDGVVRLGIQMAEALAYTHKRGILHRDLKPSNVLLTPDGVPMLLDFNLASGIEAGAQRLGGTLPYMPPEQIRDVHLQPFESNLEGDPRSDIFSLGVILYELLTGKLPFGDPPACVAPRQAAEEFLAAQRQTPRSVRDLNPEVSSKLAQLIHKCLALEPSQRPVSAADLVSELKKYLSPRRRVQRWTARHRGVVITLTLAVILTAVALAARPPFAVRQYRDGLTDMKRGKYDDAIKHFNLAIQYDANSVQFRSARGAAQYAVGVADLNRGRYDEAIEHLDLAIEDDANSVQFQSARDAAQYAVGVAHIKGGRYEDAIEHLNSVIKPNDNSENSVPFRFARGYAYQRHGDHKLAEIDLAAAANSANDPLIFECCAYSQMNIDEAAASPRISARVMYVRMAGLTELTPENELNWAFANYDIRPNLPAVINKCTAALGKRPNWQAAYYLRALAHLEAARQELQLSSGDHNENRPTASIQNAVDDFNKAVSLGPPSARLFTDAAEARAIHDGNQPSTTFQELLQLAALHGAPQSRIEAFGKGFDWSKDPWFQKVLSSCSNLSKMFSEPEYTARFLAAPNHDLVEARLSAYQLQLLQTP